jgi:hypothetical protein
MGNNRFEAKHGTTVRVKGRPQRFRWRKRYKEFEKDGSIRVYEYRVESMGVREDLVKTLDAIERMWQFFREHPKL